MNGVNSILYLENFVESTAYLPPDLQRHLSTVKALDDKCTELSETVHQAVAQLMAMPPQYQHGATEEYIQLSHRVEQDQRLLLQFAEEKVQVAQQVYDLLEMHAVELEKQIEDLEGDLRASGLDGGAMESFYGAPGFVPLDSIRGRMPKLEEWSALAPTPTGALDAPLPPMPSIRRSASTVGQKASQKRPRDESEPPPAVATIPPIPPPALASAPVAVPAVAPGASTPGAVAGAAAATASGTASMKKRALKSTQSIGSIFNSGASMDDAAFAQAGIEQEAVEQPPLVSFMTPPPPGLLPAAPKPQALGKYLYHQDITESLRGRHAELFWPPDSMWYLIEIQDVNVETKMARIVYTTGDVEQLNLDEIARDMHMSIISNDI